MADPDAVAVAEPTEVPDLGLAVSVDSFSGPLDLLLFLVRKDELDIRDIPLAGIADQFVALVRVWQERGELDLELAGDFILMAATLLEIKARAIAPPPETDGDEAADDGEDELLDPRQGLIQKLLAYRRFKEAVGLLTHLEEERALRHTRRFREDLPEDPEEADGIDLGALDSGQLFTLWDDLLKRLGGKGPRTVLKDDIPLEATVEKLVEAARAAGTTTLSTLLANEPGLLGRVTLLMATLETARKRVVEARQVEQYGDVNLRFRPEEERTGPPPELPPEVPWRKRQRKPPLVTYTAAVVGDEEEGAEPEPEAPYETDEQRFLRELNERCDLDAVLTRAVDVEAGFLEHWYTLFPDKRPKPPEPEPVVVPVAEVPVVPATPEPVPVVAEAPAVIVEAPVPPVAEAVPIVSEAPAVSEPVAVEPVPSEVPVAATEPVAEAAPVSEPVPSEVPVVATEPVAEAALVSEPVAVEPVPSEAPVAATEPAAEAVPVVPEAAPVSEPVAVEPMAVESVPNEVLTAAAEPMAEVIPVAVEPVPSEVPVVATDVVVEPVVPTEPVAIEALPVEVLPVVEPVAETPVPVEAVVPAEPDTVAVALPDPVASPTESALAVEVPAASVVVNDVVVAPEPEVAVAAALPVAPEPEVAPVVAEVIPEASAQVVDREPSAVESAPPETVAAELLQMPEDVACPVEEPVVARELHVEPLVVHAVAVTSEEPQAMPAEEPESASVVEDVPADEPVAEAPAAVMPVTPLLATPVEPPAPPLLPVAEAPSLPVAEALALPEPVAPVVEVPPVAVTMPEPSVTVATPAEPVALAVPVAVAAAAVTEAPAAPIPPAPAVIPRPAPSLVPLVVAAVWALAMVGAWWTFRITPTVPAVPVAVSLPTEPAVSWPAWPPARDWFAVAEPWTLLPPSAFVEPWPPVRDWFAVAEPWSFLPPSAFIEPWPPARDWFAVAAPWTFLPEEAFVAAVVPTPASDLADADLWRRWAGMPVPVIVDEVTPLPPSVGTPVVP